MVKKREAGDIWQGLYEFPLIEAAQTITDRNHIEGSEIWHQFINESDYSVLRVSKAYKRVLTHQKISIQFWEIQVSNFKKDYEKAGFIAISREELVGLAFPRTIDLYLSDKSLTLELF